MNRSNLPSNTNSEIVFQPLTKKDFPLICDWFNLPHVQKFYSLRDWTLEEVEKKLTPYLDVHSKIHPYLVSIAKNTNGFTSSKITPFAYIQYSRVFDFPWPNQDFDQETIDNGIGIDLFIGEEKFMKQGLGIQMVESFFKLPEVKNYTRIVVDPRIDNLRAYSFFQKVGFNFHKEIEMDDALKRPQHYSLMVKELAART